MAEAGTPSPGDHYREPGATLDELASADSQPTDLYTKELRQSFITAYHLVDSEHRSTLNTYRALRQNHMWSGMYVDVQSYVMACEVCNDSIAKSGDDGDHSYVREERVCERDPWHGASLLAALDRQRQQQQQRWQEEECGDGGGGDGSGVALCDVTLVVQGSPLCAHRCVLAACSSTLQELLRHNQGAIVHLPGFLKHAFLPLLDFCYTSKLSFPVSHLSEVQTLAELLQMDAAVGLCEASIAKRDPSARSIGPDGSLSVETKRPGRRPRRTNRGFSPNLPGAVNSPAAIPPLLGSYSAQTGPCDWPLAMHAPCRSIRANQATFPWPDRLPGKRPFADGGSEESPVKHMKLQVERVTMQDIRISSGTAPNLAPVLKLDPDLVSPEQNIQSLPDDHFTTQTFKKHKLLAALGLRCSTFKSLPPPRSSPSSLASTSMSVVPGMWGLGVRQQPEQQPDGMWQFNKLLRRRIVQGFIPQSVYLQRKQGKLQRPVAPPPKGDAVLVAASAVLAAAPVPKKRGRPRKVLQPPATGEAVPEQRQKRSHKNKLQWPPHAAYVGASSGADFSLWGKGSALAADAAGSVAECGTEGRSSMAGRRDGRLLHMSGDHGRCAVGDGSILSIPVLPRRRGRPRKYPLAPRPGGNARQPIPLVASQQMPSIVPSSDRAPTAPIVVAGDGNENSTARTRSAQLQDPVSHRGQVGSATDQRAVVSLEPSAGLSSWTGDFTGAAAGEEEVRVGEVRSGPSSNPNPNGARLCPGSELLVKRKRGRPTKATLPKPSEGKWSTEKVSLKVSGNANGGYLVGSQMLDNTSREASGSSLINSELSSASERLILKIKEVSDDGGAVKIQEIEQVTVNNSGGECSNGEDCDIAGPHEERKDVNFIVDDEQLSIVRGKSPKKSPAFPKKNSEHLSQSAKMSLRSHNGSCEDVFYKRLPQLLLFPLLPSSVGSGATEGNGHCDEERSQRAIAESPKSTDALSTQQASESPQKHKEKREVAAAPVVVTRKSYYMRSSSEATTSKSPCKRPERSTESKKTNTLHLGPVNSSSSREKSMLNTQPNGLPNLRVWPRRHVQVPKKLL